METLGDGFTLSILELEAGTQVMLDKLDKAGPTSKRYIPVSDTATLVRV